MDELYKDRPTHTNTYEVDGVKHKVVSHFVGDRDINDVMLGYAFNRQSVGSNVCRCSDFLDSRL